MDERLNEAPCGYLSLADDSTILEVNGTLQSWLGCGRSELQGRFFHSSLAAPSRVFYQIYFFPLIKLNGKVDEMYLSLKTADGTELPVLLNAVRKERGGAMVSECVLVPMRRRMEYERRIMDAERAAEAARVELEQLGKLLESKRRELADLSPEPGRRMP